MRWRPLDHESLDESQIGMGLLVHHSFPDEIELANGVATLTRVGPNYTVEMVTQVGATSVANPSDGSLPETVRLLVFKSGSVATELVQESNLLPLGATVLEWMDDYEDFGALFAGIAKAFETETGKSQYTLDFEYKKIAPDDQLIVKQVRQIPQPDREKRITPFLIDVPEKFTTFQGEIADAFSNQRLKSTWTLETENMWLTEENLRNGIFTRVKVDYTDSCDVFQFDGDTSSLPQVEESYGEDRVARLRWSFDQLPNRRQYELATGAVQLLVSPSESPFVTLQDLRLRVSVTYEHPVLGWNGSSQDTELTTDEYIVLAVEPKPGEDDLEQVRSFTQDGVSFTTRFYWPPPPGGATAGYTAPLVRWVSTVIEGLTTEPIVLLGERSQTYRPGHHNFTEQFLFAPHEEDGISSQILAELDAQDIRWIHVFAANTRGRFETYGACELALACACGTEEPTFLRGDCNGDGTVDVTDPVANLGFQFLGTFEPPCLDALDFNDSGEMDVTDPIASLTHQFLGGPPPSAPGKDACGFDPTDDDLTCESFAACAADG